MRSSVCRLVMVLSATAVLAVSAGAQGPGGFGNLSPQQQAQLQAKRKAWEKFRANNKHVTALQESLMGIGSLERDPKTRLNKKQAQAVLACLKKWGSKKVLTNDEARKANLQLTGTLTPDQLQKLSQNRGFGRGGQGFGGGARPSGGPGNGARPGGRRPSFDISKMPDPKPYNPLNPDTLPFERLRPIAKQHLNELRASLTQRAK